RPASSLGPLAISPWLAPVPGLAACGLPGAGAARAAIVKALPAGLHPRFFPLPRLPHHRAPLLPGFGPWRLGRIFPGLKLSGLELPGIGAVIPARRDSLPRCRLFPSRAVRLPALLAVIGPGKRPAPRTESGAPLLAPPLVEAGR